MRLSPLEPSLCRRLLSALILLATLSIACSSDDPAPPLTPTPLATATSTPASSASAATPPSSSSPTPAAPTPPPTPTPPPAPIATPPPSPTPPSPAPNLLPNPSFELAAENSSLAVDGWHYLSREGMELVPLTDRVAHTGTRSLVLPRRIAVCPTTCGYWTLRPVAIDPSKTYAFSFWVRSTLPPDVALAIGFNYVDSAGAITRQPGMLAVANLPGEWAQMRFRAGHPIFSPACRCVDLPPGTVAVYLDLSWLGNLSVDRLEGDIWLDDLYLGVEP